MIEKTYIYAFEFLDCIHEGSWTSISLHKTKKGAYLAMRKYLLDECEKWDQERRLHGYWKDGFKTSADLVFSEFSRWSVYKYELNE